MSALGMQGAELTEGCGVAALGSSPRCCRIQVETWVVSVPQFPPLCSGLSTWHRGLLRALEQTGMLRASNSAWCS